ncbi:MAG TPA: bifunctional phosphopantothenoylcysteine decarboxylase/phosphopantothenate--cysteine ligase CoaBC [Solirubrobacterales bacterium]|jgi:phosphopantothenoylcysteine decarboxylase/phosphopantothenate--cysteine ligase|nr:bifunctional phosphopantothenoylcysteine decarboxylase/phosphopantothenate--cysteine ligase CoaBC [Solirubrobacterales bacterium]
MARILLGVTGGIAAYKAVELARLATREGNAVRVLLTPAATRFVGAASFEGIVGAPVLSDEFERDPARGAFPGDPEPAHDPIGHLEVVANADAYLIAPASANTIAKLAAGIADSMVTTSFLACAAPRLVAPAMNDRMYRDPATQANLATLRERGIAVIEPEEGALASRGEHGVGRLPEPRRLLDAVESLVPGPTGPWDGLRVLVSAGGTREPIDPVRFIGNRSSGRMGLALAERAARRGAEVTLVAANVVLPAPPEVRRVNVETADQLRAALEAEFDHADVLLMAAAPADFRPAVAADSKLSRESSGMIELDLEATDDILAALAARRREGQTIVGFAAETPDTGATSSASRAGLAGLDRAREKLARKGADAIVLNDVSRAEIGFESRENEVVIVEREGEHAVPLAAKEQVADAILDRVEVLRGRSAPDRASD